MSQTQEQLFQAREFAELAGVTVRALHHYDRTGLLRPTRYTAAGYRLYTTRDLARLQQIVTLKFIGLSLREIKEVLDGRPSDLRETLRLQRRVVGERIKGLEMAARAIDRAAAALASSGRIDWEALREIVEVISMQNDMEWVKKYYTEEQLADLARRATPEVLERGQREWAQLIEEVEASLGEDPASEHAQSLAARWTALIEEFTGGDPGIAESLRRLYADQANWPSNFKKPYPDSAADFIAKAIAARREG